jgi:hypothetical protein
MIHTFSPSNRKEVRMNTADERDVDPIEEMNRIGQDILSLASRGFRESFRSTTPGKLIFDSKLCRIGLIWGGWDYGGGNSMHILYGRLHAPNNSVTMLWNGELCTCWHDIDHPLNFLDGRLPADVVRRYYSHPITDPFYEETYRQQFKRRQPEWLAQMHLSIWQHYGNRFFELFDAQRNDLWQQYQSFISAFYKIRGRRPGDDPAQDKVC